MRIARRGRLAVASRLLRRGGRLVRVELVLGFTLLAAILVMLNYLAGRHFVRWDWTPTRVFSLSPKTVHVLSRIERPLQITVFMVPPERMTESVYGELRELLQRFRRHCPRLQVEYLDIDADPARAELLAKRYAIYERELREGVVVLASGDRSKYLPARALADRDLDGRIVAFRGEQALLAAVLSLLGGEPPRVCFGSGHGEAAIDSYEAAGYGYLADEVRRDNYRVRAIGPLALADVTPARCRVVVLGGPQRRLSPVEQDGLDSYLRRGGRLLLLLGPLIDRAGRRYSRIGVEKLLEGWGVELPSNVVLDPFGIPGQRPLLTWGTRDGYGDHPVSRSFGGRLTIWPLAREVRPRAAARPGLRATSLVHTSSAGWAEADLGSLIGEDRSLRFDPAVDTPGPVSVGVAVSWRETRLVVLGSERGLLNRRLDGSDYSRDLFLSALAWLAGEQPRVGVGPRRAEQLRLALDEQQLERIFLLVVVALPGCMLACGVIIWWRRRQR